MTAELQELSALAQRRLAGTPSANARLATWEWHGNADALVWSPALEDLFPSYNRHRPLIEAALRDILEPVRVAAAGAPWETFELETSLPTDTGQRELLVYAHAATEPGVLRGVLVDPAVRRRADPAAEDRYRLLVELIPDAVVVHQQGVIVYANPSAARFAGAGAVEDLVGRPITSFVHPESQRAMAERIAKLVEPGVPSEPADTRFLTLDGGEVHMESVSVRTTWQGKPALQVILRDLTASRTAEESLRYQAALVSHVSDAIIATDASGRITSWNPAAEAAFGRSGDGVIGRRVVDVLGPALDPARLLGGGGVEDVIVRGAGGTLLSVRASAARLGRDGDGFVLVCADETARRRAEAQYATVVAALEEGVVVVGPDGSVQSANPAAERILGVAPGALLGRVVTSFAVLDENGLPLSEDALPAVRTARTGDSEHGRIVSFDRANGRRGWLSVNSSALPHSGPGSQSVVVSFTDVTDGRVNAAALEHAASHDPLTGLTNRSHLLVQLREAKASARARGTVLAVLFIDLDNFKVINDSLGHSIGDEVLVIAARRLRDSVRAPDIVSRLGGDEFVVASAELAAPSDAYLLAERVQAALAQPLRGRMRRMQLQGSIGIVLSGPDDPRSPDDLLRDADAAMYQAKGSGRNRSHVFDHELRTRALRRLALEEDMRDALLTDEFWTAYQPIINLRERQVTGFEALSRWTSAVHGNVGPAEFIPIAEQTSLIHDLGQRVLLQACRDVGELRRREGRNLAVSVNISARQLDDAGIVDNVERVLRRAGLEPGALCLEVTETALSSDVSRAAATLSAVRRMGVRVAIDDFGVGYSSLGQLRRLPVDSVKIDRSFVREIDADPESRVIVASIIALAHTLGHTVVAEGVERAGQEEILADLACDFVQGYRYGAPRRLWELSPQTAAAPTVG